MLKDEIACKIKKIGKLVGTLAIAGAAAWGAVKPEAEAQRAIAQNTFGYQEMSKSVADLQKWVSANRIRTKRAEMSCKAEVAAIQAYVAGYLLALSRTPSTRYKSADQAVTGKAVKALLEKLGKAKEVGNQDKAKLPKLAPPAPMHKVIQRMEQKKKL